jgi:hypothetical protein
MPGLSLPNQTELLKLKFSWPAATNLILNYQLNILHSATPPANVELNLYENLGYHLPISGEILMSLFTEVKVLYTSIIFLIFFLLTLIFRLDILLACTLHLLKKLIHDIIISLITINLIISNTYWKPAVDELTDCVADGFSFFTAFSSLISFKKLWIFKESSLSFSVSSSFKIIIIYNKFTYLEPIKESLFCSFHFK